ncbi:hypothetical protein [Stenotrophomonas sp. NPDC077659]|uniref:hypothetical protein n=1 Tax=Stenotrophomonas sp. NPDC077659 TaxID=3390694 RepID=UPI003D0480C6
MLTFHRPEFARELAESLLGIRLFGATSGLFLANRRRTGKTTFLLADLKPALENLGAVVVYVDLWADQQMQPGALIAKAIGSTLREHEGVGAKAIAGGLRKISALGVTVEVGSAQLGNEVSLADMLAELHRLSQRKIVLIIDEAQQATVPGSGGMEAMAALKSARDQLNLGGKYTLGIVMTGSDRDKLCRLVNTNMAPFFGSEIDIMPTLDHHYTDWMADLVENDRHDIRVDRGVLHQAFADLGHRPELLHQIIGQLTGIGRPPADRFNEVLAERAAQERGACEVQYANTYAGLKPAAKAVLSRILAGRGQGMFKPDAKAEYRQVAGKTLADTQIQGALDKMRGGESPLIWKSDRGDYALEDTRMRDWYQSLKNSGNWPPVP